MLPICYIRLKFDMYIVYLNKLILEFSIKKCITTSDLEYYINFNQSIFMTLASVTEIDVKVKFKAHGGKFQPDITKNMIIIVQLYYFEFA